MPDDAVIEEDFSSEPLLTTLELDKLRSEHYNPTPGAECVICLLIEYLDASEERMREALRGVVQLCDMHSLTVPLDARRLADLASTRPKGGDRD